ncbi:hypothetical protein [Anaerotruncus rubiinfantis]|uniref:hypothetical protein n=1 Tax=Anaerotruncus rubiinfantis TaxID=1720200 RepID=UPI003D79BBD3
MPLKKAKYINRKALAIIYQLLAGDSQPPAIFEEEKVYWVTNGYVAYAFRKNMFIFNPAIFRQCDIGSYIDLVREKATTAIRANSFRVSRNGKGMIAKLTPENGSECAVYVNKEYLDSFSKECMFFTTGNPLDPIYVKSFYGEECGIILPIRVSSESW